MASLAQETAELETLGSVTTGGQVRVARSARPDGATAYRLSWYEIADDGSKKRRQTWVTGTPAAAVQKARNLRRQPQHTSTTAPSGASLTIKKFTEMWLNSTTPSGWSATHYAQRSAMLREIFAGHEEDDVATLTPESLASLIAAGSTPDVQHRRRNTLRELLDWGHRNGHITQPRQTLLARVELPRRPPPRGGRVVTPRLSTFYEALNAAEKHCRERWGHAAADEGVVLMLTLLMTGIRPGELYALRARDVDPAFDRLTVRSTLAEPRTGLPLLKSPKSGKHRVIAYPKLSFSQVTDLASLGVSEQDLLSEAMSGIDIYNFAERLRTQRTRVIKEHGKSALLFARAQSARPRKAQEILGVEDDPVPEGQRFWLKSTFMQQFWNPIRDKVPSWKVEGITPYSIRHLYATWRLNSLGHTPAEVAAAMGHRGVDLVFQRYVATPDLPEAATAWLPPGASPLTPE